MEKVALKIINFKLKIIDFITNNRTEVLILVVILLVGAFFRLYKIDQYMTFLGDEGRDAIIVRNLLVHLDPILIGPGTSVGGMYLGPLYYYFISPFLFLANYSPVGPAVEIALLGVVTIYLIYIVGKNWFGKIVGLVSAALYALSPTVIIYSRSSWNPNIMPFFSLLAVYSIWKAYVSKKYNWLIISSISFAFVMQSHYLGLLLLPIIGIFWLMIIKNTWKDKHLKLYAIRYTLYAISIFVFLMSPLAIFDVRHDFLNSKALYKFLTVRQETVSIRPWTAIPKSYPIFEQINTSLLGANNMLIGKYISLLMTIMIICFIFKKYISFKHFNNLTMLVLWFIVGLIGFGIYKQHIYDHYFGFLFAVPFLLFGVIYQKILETKFKLVAVLLFCLIVYNFIANSPLLKQPNNQLTRSQSVAQKIAEESGDKNFNIAVIAERNYEDGYQYFLEKNNAKIIEIDAQVPESVTEQLFVICEVNGSTLTREKCDPTHSPKAEVAGFGWSKIDNQWEIDGVMIYKLIHSK